MKCGFTFGFAIFSSAFLLFEVEPILGKMILPWFGGSAAVWIVCLLFFQILLFLGYLYAHLLASKFGFRAQARIHAAALLASLLALPILPKAPWKPSDPSHPALDIIGLLGAAIGLPYFLLASTSPILQSWHGRQNNEDASPYRLYAASNAGSMLALTCYPVLVEPWVATTVQGRAWSWLYAVFVVLCAVLGLSATRARQGPQDTGPEAMPSPGRGTRLLWLSLAACASALLLAVTRHITQNVAAVPLLWAIPLALYLLTFILCFEARSWYRRNLFLRLLGVALGSMAYSLSPSFTGLPLTAAIPLFCGCLFVCCMFCHGELARLTPHPAYLTSFYLMISLGGAIGGVFVALVAPWLFAGTYELPLALAGCAFLALVVLHRDPDSPYYQARWQLSWLLVVSLATAIVISLGVAVREQGKGSRLMVRNFYGVLRIVDQVAPNVVLLNGRSQRAADGDLRFQKLMNGTIDHGLQFLSPALRDLPTTYYGPKSGIGIILKTAEGVKRLNVGVVGLGIGTLAAYGRPGDRYKFYEINPLVFQLASQEFKFLHDSQAEINLVLGDGRLSLERDAPGQFDVLVIDAFSGDSIPVHLLTREAFDLYFRRLKPGGVLAVHISNQYLNLAPVVNSAACWFGKEAVLVENKADSLRGIYRATWVLVGDREGFIGKPELERVGTILGSTRRQIPWTDDYSSLFQVLL